MLSRILRTLYRTIFGKFRTTAFLFLSSTQQSLIFNYSAIGQGLKAELFLSGQTERNQHR